MILFKRSLLFTILIFIVALLFEFSSNHPITRVFIMEEASDSIINGILFFIFLFLLNKKTK